MAIILSKHSLWLVSSLTEVERAKLATASRIHRPKPQQRAEFAELARQWRERATRRAS